MQIKTTERTLRDLFHGLQARGETDAAVGVYLAARALYLPQTAWHFTPETTIGIVHLRATQQAAS